MSASSGGWSDVVTFLAALSQAMERGLAVRRSSWPEGLLVRWRASWEWKPRSSGKWEEMPSSFFYPCGRLGAPEMLATDWEVTVS
jgi:hypothetical protein